MSGVWRSVKIREFEHVAAGPSVVLLRVTGRAPRRRLSPAERPALLIGDGDREQRFAALPSPPDDRGVARAAYSVPVAVMAHAAAFYLETSEGTRIPLPRPTPAATQLASRPKAAAAAPSAGEAGDLAGALKAARTAIERLTRERDEAVAALRELEIWSGELQRRMADASTELGAAQTQLRAESDQRAQLRDELAAARTRAELAESRVASFEELLRTPPGDPAPEPAPAIADDAASGAVRASAVLPAAPDGDGTAAVRSRSPEELQAIAQLSRQAEAQAAQAAERELAEAVAPRPVKPA